jgi:hypothetical protein
MRQVAYPAALGSCAFGATAASPVRAAEWIFTPAYSLSSDYDSNRSLVHEGTGSAAGSVSADVKVERRMEDLSFTLEPHYTLRRFTQSVFGDGDDRTIAGGMNWLGERSSLNLSASYLDQSTLVTEVLETGITNGDTHKRAEQAGGAWTWGHTERRTSVAQVNYSKVSYYGLSHSLLPGYRYSSGSLGEQFGLNERCMVTFSAFGTKLDGQSQGNSSHEIGLQGEVVYLWSDTSKLDASLGESKRVLSSQSSNGTDASVVFTHSVALGGLSFSYRRSLVPYGFGFLVEQQTVNGTFTYKTSPYWDSALTYYRTQNNETAVLLRLDRRNYNTLALVFNVHPTEKWTVGAQIGAVRTQTPDETSLPVHSWRASLAVTWASFPKSRSW